MSEQAHADPLPVLGYEPHNEQLWPIVRLALIAGAAFFLSGSISELLNFLRTLSQAGPYALISNYFATAFSLLEILSPMVVMIGCVLCLRGAARVRFILWAIGIWMATRLIYVGGMIYSYARMHLSTSFTTRYVVLLYAQTVLGMLGGFVFPILLMLILTRPSVRELLDRR